ncbi:hypothetical protein [Streptomyces sviceus]|uniref:hypothetical protein n=1 Tax=Streptomyces sviceus TaxID=285530 RepID=UPI0036EE8077
MSPAPDERDRIRAAMDRILQGTAQHSNGALTIVALAQEAGVPRNALTQRHLDLKSDFYAQVRARGQTPDSEIRLRQQIVKLRELRAKDIEELSQLRADVEHLVRAVNQLTVENRQLSGALSQPAAPVRVLPSGRNGDALHEAVVAEVGQALDGGPGWRALRHPPEESPTTGAATRAGTRPAGCRRRPTATARWLCWFPRESFRRDFGSRFAASIKTNLSHF